jgi:hypothetical protein
MFRQHHSDRPTLVWHPIAHHGWKENTFFLLVMAAIGEILGKSVASINKPGRTTGPAPEGGAVFQHTDRVRWRGVQPLIRL